MNEIAICAFLILVLSISLLYIVFRFRRLVGNHAELGRIHAELVSRFQPVVDVDAEKQRVLADLEVQRAQISADTIRVHAEQAAERQRMAAEVAAERARHSVEVDRVRQAQQQAAAALRDRELQAQSELRTLNANIAALRAEFAKLDEESNLQSFAFYRPRYNFTDSARYQAKLESIRDGLKAMLKDKSAAVCSEEWTVNGSKSEGRKQINQTLKLMLRAFNGESDAAIAKVRYNNIHVMEARIRKAHETVNGLAEVQSCRITGAYLGLKLEELYLVHEYEQKVQQEKDEQRRIREQMREEEIALREIEKAKADAEKEEARYADALRRAQEEIGRATGLKQQKLMSQVAELERKLAEASVNKQRALSRAQMTRSGHVYIISNLGSFGEQVYKIGMTRRLDPMDRVKELGDASVPFEFDVHAILYTEDAPGLENQLHRAFHHRRVNRVNHKKEFFRVDLTEIVTFVREHHSADIEIVHTAEAEEYRQTLALTEQELRALTA